MLSSHNTRPFCEQTRSNNKRTSAFSPLVIGFAVLTSAFLPAAFADEGMWTLNGFPTKKVEKKYGFRATDPWLKQVRLASARLAEGCSGSFVSDNGLVMTNHHCADSCIAQLSTPKKDFIASGFYAPSLAEEVRCPEMEVNRLVEISDITAKVKAATKGMSGQAFARAQKAAMASIEKECSGNDAALRCDVVSLYHGGLYHLYKYKRYQDVRLVFAPEKSIAFFGGDPDNFMFPRYDLDVTFVRVYENDKPLKGGEYFKWSQTPAVENDLTFVTGHPGHTSRLLTVAELEFHRDSSLIKSIIQNSELRGLLTAFSERGAEQKRIAESDLFGIENGLKARKGRLETLIDKSFFAKKQKDEAELRRKVNANPKWKKEYGDAWDEIAKAVTAFRDIFPAYWQLENNRSWNSLLFRHARALVRAAEELPKPNGERLREFTDSNIPAIQQDLFSSAPIYPEYEVELLTFGLTKLRENLTAGNPIVKRLFGPRSPREIAEDIVKNTRLADVNERKRLFEGGKKAIETSKDPMILFAALVDREALPLRQNYEDNIESIMIKSSEKIAAAKFAVYGTDTYPDATFTLRISYGQIKGYMENGTSVAPITTIGGAFDHATGREPFALPESWIKAKNHLNLKTPFNLCSTNDIIGGNSGSPMINSKAEIVGLIFDGNIQSLGGDYWFDESVNRAVAVHSAAILETLKNVYKADRVVSDLLNAH